MPATQTAASMEFETAPRILPQYVRAALAGGELNVGETIPRIEASLDTIAPDFRAIRKYAKVCGFQLQDRLPVTYPHVLAFPLHMSLLTNDAFPLKLLGLVHIRNEIHQLQAIPLDAHLSVHTWVDGHRRERLGIEFDVHTEVKHDGALVWRSVSTNLSRRKSKPSKRGSQPETWPDFDKVASLSAPGNIGRRYGRVAGDVNPIHLTALSAKLFGFKRAIAHGMWTKARVAAELDQHEGLFDGAAKYAVAFRKPIFLPGRVQMHWQGGASSTEIVVSGTKGATLADKLIHMRGSVEKT